MREYWGGMLAEGATSFWEAYDLRWPKQNPHLSLQADGTSGYFVSLAHGWSSGPAAWLMEEVLGIRAVEAGYRKTVVRPDMLGMAWIKGQVPTPQGPIRVEMRRATETTIDLSLPPLVEATVLVPVAHSGAEVLINGVVSPSTPMEAGVRAAIMLRKPGNYTITSR
jgi:alpha-L-rhamnosidase